MHASCPRWFLLVLIAGCLGSDGFSNIAPWADKGLPVHGELELWFDAARENEAREAHYMNRLSTGDRMEFWHDSSGHARHGTQWIENARPRFRSATEGNWVEFDGDDFFSSLVTPGIERKEVTVFLVTRPDSASGDFDGFFSATRRGENDYTSGLNLDLGKTVGKENWPAFNVEGGGQSGAVNLLLRPVPLRAWHRISLTSGPGKTHLRIDGLEHGTRDRGDMAMAMDMFSLGARLVGIPPAVRHHFRGAIAELLVFGRRLDAVEMAKVEAWLTRKHERLAQASPLNTTRPPETPMVRMLVPGFTVQELPVQLTTLVNLEYGPDGRLFAGGYDGRFHLLRDTDGDGLEDRVETFSSATTGNYPLGMAVREGALHTVLSDEIVRFRDGNGDDVPDIRETVAKGWDDPLLANDVLLHHRRVDAAMALAIGPDGAFYTTMGSASYDNGYWQEKQDRTTPPRYTTDKRRGCLLRITPDGKVEQLASGLRYVMSLQFNRHGDLFATDQEGATWLPNGNPFDELLHLEPNRHYGFPPRHPKWLPNVIDEPSLWNYAPQHQSTCGFRFNGPGAGRGRFGPESWAHDAIVTGESRGKLWRTSLAKTAAGYVAETQLFATLGMLVIDCAISPDGALVVCCHPGPTDWGEGPSGNGRLFKIRHTESAVPQPLRAWAASPTETVVEFDRPLDADAWRDAIGGTRIEYGRFVSAGDRHEVLKPGYQVVSQVQQREPRKELPVRSVRLAPGGRALLIESEPRPMAVHYALSLNGMELAHQLTGLAAEWKGNKESWQGWVPHADFVVATEFGRSSALHSAFRERLAKTGSLTLRSQLDLWQMLQPAVQPGSKLDYTPAPETVRITFKSDAALALNAPGANVERVSAREMRLIISPRESIWTPITLTVATPARLLEASFSTDQDPRPRALGISRFLLPFATPPAGFLEKAQLLSEIAGGDWEKGRVVFETKAACATCHAIRGKGARVGPDLSNLASRDYAAVLRDIEEPNATINPDAVGYMATLKDGSSVTGVRSAETPELLELVQPGGTTLKIQKTELLNIEPLKGSLMPAGLLQSLSVEERRDLMRYLFGEQPKQRGE